ncbi:MAG: hypothetical protein HY721_34625 [Planctomycetes bacterium]|nr:hypothetical protein [Planctomycetota bacterium]
MAWTQDGALNHVTHVPPEWLDRKQPETRRDCAGCHDPLDPRHRSAAEDPPVARHSVCTRCHVNEGFSATDRCPVPPRGETGVFRHAEHFRKPHRGINDCRECHWPGAAITARMPIPLGSGFCVFCHDPHNLAPEQSPERRRLAQETVGRLRDRLNTSPELGPAGFRRFSHLDHIQDLPSPKDAGAWKECVEPCHASMPRQQGLDARGKFDLERFMVEVTQKACGKCHVTDERLPNGAFAVRPFMLAELVPESRSAGTFSHAVHLAEPALAKSRELLDQGCLQSRCHVWNVRGRVYTVKPRYDGCIASGCHTEWRLNPTVNVALGIDEPAHDRIDAARCQGCHVLGLVTDMKGARPQVEVRRERPGTFSVESQEHPLIIEGDRRGDCAAECHRAVLSVLASRIQGVSFQHATHLPPAGVTQEYCEPCHKGIAATKRPREIATEGGVPLYDATACGECHKGDAPEPDARPPAAPKPEWVPLFAHAEHVGRARLVRGKEAKLTCLDCHEGNLEDGVAGIGIQPQAKACTSCHDHKNQFQITGRVREAYLQTCAKCHTKGVPPSRPRGWSPDAVARDRIVGAAAHQFHPVPPTAPDAKDGVSCCECHFRARADRARPDTEPCVTAQGFVKGGGPGRAKFHVDKTETDRSVLRDCCSCHWGDVSERPVDERIPCDPKVERPRLGERLEGFPGTRSSGRPGGGA